MPNRKIITSAEKTVKAVQIDDGVKLADVQIIPFSDNQQIAPFRVVFTRIPDGVHVVCDFNPTGQKGASISNTSPIIIAILDGPLNDPIVLGYTPQMPWAAACHQENPHHFTFNLHDIFYENVKAIRIPALSGTSLPCKGNNGKK